VSSLRHLFSHTY